MLQRSGSSRSISSNVPMWDSASPSRNPPPLPLPSATMDHTLARSPSQSSLHRRSRSTSPVKHSINGMSYLSASSSDQVHLSREPFQPQHVRVSQDSLDVLMTTTTSILTNLEKLIKRSKDNASDLVALKTAVKEGKPVVLPPAFAPEPVVAPTPTTVVEKVNVVKAVEIDLENILGPLRGLLTEFDRGVEAKIEQGQHSFNQLVTGQSAEFERAIKAVKVDVESVGEDFGRSLDMGLEVSVRKHDEALGKVAVKSEEAVSASLQPLDNGLQLFSARLADHGNGLARHGETLASAIAAHTSALATTASVHEQALKGSLGDALSKTISTHQAAVSDAVSKSATSSLAQTTSLHQSSLDRVASEHGASLKSHEREFDASLKSIVYEHGQKLESSLVEGVNAHRTGLESTLSNYSRQIEQDSQALGELRAEHSRTMKKQVAELEILVQKKATAQQELAELTTELETRKAEYAELARKGEQLEKRVGEAMERTIENLVGSVERVAESKAAKKERKEKEREKRKLRPIEQGFDRRILSVSNAGAEPTPRPGHARKPSFGKKMWRALSGSGSSFGVGVGTNQENSNRNSALSISEEGEVSVGSEVSASERDTLTAGSGGIGKARGLYGAFRAPGVRSPGGDGSGVWEDGQGIVGVNAGAEDGEEVGRRWRSVSERMTLT
ncbi:hypothetical protein SAICODRAFT_69921 [Saitoella complicata NRRL Y-17804]|uniref:uncharacterized protein n=1 Tax=Saitoella complicata (strain BCRC 22490 / CBS 7301 / JCM 7358 / NBRC 10748 / NRRL Y-17804) TaxID=698492 RepID=UPI000868156F|nr:uncharacterized protein SAICODRAFT_69921 [Saitoella complicata NRRL Y-17804]ODQ54735.1 hypothetical protein SAICODRAFT_69921 [Saitoella complicata NRRL Y-17804]